MKIEMKISLCDYNVAWIKPYPRICAKTRGDTNKDRIKKHGIDITTTGALDTACKFLIANINGHNEKPIPVDDINLSDPERQFDLIMTKYHKYVALSFMKNKEN